MKQLVYIAGPYSPSNGMTMQENTVFAEKLGKLAQNRGLAPIVPHSSILRGVYGNDLDDHERNAGIASTMAILELVARDPKSELWVIADTGPEGQNVLSTGTQMEVDRWTELRGLTQVLVLDREHWIEFINHDNIEQFKNRQTKLHGNNNA